VEHVATSPVMLRSSNSCRGCSTTKPLRGVLDECTSAVSVDVEQQLYASLHAAGIPCITMSQVSSSNALARTSNALARFSKALARSSNALARSSNALADLPCITTSQRLALPEFHQHELALGDLYGSGRCRYTRHVSATESA